MKIVKNRIRYFREREMLTQDALAKLLDADYSTVSKWETICALPAGKYLIKLCEIFGCTIGELLYISEQDAAQNKITRTSKKQLV